VRVKNKNVDVTIELIPKGGKKQIYWVGPNSANVAAYDASKWTKVKVPDGMTVEQFDQAVLNLAALQTAGHTGHKYSVAGDHNSNNFVYEVITGAGGKVPLGATIGFKLGAPGACGGSDARTGNDCE
jgi:hypothetical protein